MKSIGVSIWFALFVIINFLPSQVLAQDSISWLKVNWPPFMILQEGKLESGVAALQLQLLQKNMPEYKHSNDYMNWGRFWHDVEAGKHVCNILSLKTQKRSKVAAFSLPVTIVLPNVVVAKKSTIKKLGNTSEISILTLIENNKLLGAAEYKRSYTANLDKILLEHQQLIYLQRLSIPARAIFRMMLANRIDYTLEYPSVISYLLKQNNINPNEISTIRIKEFKPYEFGHVACPNNAWGKKVISRINAILKKERPTEYYRQLADMYGFSKEDIRLIHKVYDSHFLKIE